MMGNSHSLHYIGKGELLRAPNLTLGSYTRIVGDFPGGATVSVAPVGVSPAERCATGKFTRSMAVRAFR
jgi:hypothetical protein